MNSCIKVEKNLNSPLVSVIKYQSATIFVDIDEANKYADLIRIYSELNLNKKEIQELWKKTYISFKKLADKDKKFTNIYKYYDYNITEITNTKVATVIFEDKFNKEKIFYYLKLSNDLWKIVNIEYSWKNRQ
jgi:hypothetical protein